MTKNELSENDRFFNQIKSNLKHLKEYGIDTELTKEESEYCLYINGRKYYSGCTLGDLSNICDMVNFSIDCIESLESANTYDVEFNDETSSNRKGFSDTIEYCKNYIKNYNGTDESYFKDYKGGTVSVVCKQTGKTVFNTTVK